MQCILAWYAGVAQTFIKAFKVPLYLVHKSAQKFAQISPHTYNACTSTNKKNCTKRISSSHKIKESHIAVFC